MKAIRYFSAVVAMLALAVSCKEEEIKPGEPDYENCPGVYIPQQENAGAHVFTPEEEAKLTFVAKRGTEEGSLIIPPVVSDTTKDKILVVEDIRFENGQTETEFSVDFSAAQPGVTYAFSISLPDDPQIVSIYSAQPTSVSFSVLRVRWLPAGKPKEGETENDGIGKWRDDIFGGPIGSNGGGNKNPEWDVEILEREDKPGYYKVLGMYSQEMVKDYFSAENLAKGYHLDATVEGVDVIIDATNPNKVWFPHNDCQWTFYSDNGSFGFSSYVGVLNLNKDLYGTLKDGIITFPKDGILFWFDNEPYGLANTSGLTRIVLPGYRAADYSLSIAPDGLSASGKQPLNISLGADVDSVAYAGFEGKLDEAGISEAVASITDKRVEVASVTASGSVEVSFDKTGLYTVVAVGYEIGEDGNAAKVAQASVDFAFVAADDSKPVVVTVGAEATNRYAKQGITPENSINVYIQGEDLTAVGAGVFKYLDVVAKYDAIVESLQGEAYAFDAEKLAKVNGDGWDAMVTSLAPGTKYVYMVYASNGYEEDVKSVEFTTAGDPLPVYDTYTPADMAEGKVKSDYLGTWNYYAIDMAKTVGMREYIGQAVATDSATPDSEPDEDGIVSSYVSIKGLLPTKYDYDDTTEWEFYDGFLYNVCTPMGKLGPYFTMAMPVEADGGKVWLANFSSAVIGGFVKDGYIAFQTSGATESFYASYGYTIKPLDGFAAVAFSDDSYLDGSGFLGKLAWYVNLLLVDPEKDDNGLAPEAGESSVAASVASVQPVIGAVNKILSGKFTNKVETRRGRFQSAVDAARKMAFAQGRVSTLTAPRTLKSVSMQVNKANGGASVAPKSGLACPKKRIF